VPDASRPRRATALALAGQVAVYLALWFLFTGTLSLHELLVGTAASVAAAAAGTLARPRHQPFPDLGSVAQVWRLPRHAVTGTVEILGVLARQVLAGRPAESLLLGVPFDGGPGAQGRLRAVLAVAYTSATPNFLVLGIDPERGILVFHQVKRSALPEMTRRLGAKG